MIGLIFMVLSTTALCAHSVNILVIDEGLDPQYRNTLYQKRRLLGERCDRGSLYHAAVGCLS